MTAENFIIKHEGTDEFYYVHIDAGLQIITVSPAITGPAVILSLLPPTEYQLSANEPLYSPPWNPIQCIPTWPPFAARRPLPASLIR